MKGQKTTQLDGEKEVKFDKEREKRQKKKLADVNKIFTTNIFDWVSISINQYYH